MWKAKQEVRDAARGWSDKGPHPVCVCVRGDLRAHLAARLQASSAEQHREGGIRGVAQVAPLQASKLQGLVKRRAAVGMKAQREGQPR